MEPPHYSATTYAWVLWLSWWGAAAAYLQKLKNNDIHLFSWWTFFIELITAGLAGLLTFYLGDWRELDGRLMAVVIALSGHFSTTTLLMLRNRLWSRAGGEP